jgi:hypothetical protein
LDQRDRHGHGGGPEREHPAQQAALERPEPSFHDSNAGQQSPFQRAEPFPELGAEFGRPLPEPGLERADAALEPGAQVGPQLGDPLLELPVDCPMLRPNNSRISDRYAASTTLNHSTNSLAISSPNVS